MLRAGTTCADAIKFLDDELLGGSLNDTANRIPVSVSLPGLTCEQVLNEIRTVRKRYDEWTWQAAEEINRRLADRAISGQLRSGRYRAILAAPLGEARLLMLMEFAELREYVRATANRVREMQARHGRPEAARYMVLDTNTTLHFMRFDKVPWQKEFGKGATVVIPHVVVDEIDTKSYQTGDKKISKRARGVFRLLESVLEEGSEEGKADDGTAVLIAADEPGHARLPVPDDELVASAVRLQQAVAPVEVVVSRDIGEYTSVPRAPARGSAPWTLHQRRLRAAGTLIRSIRLVSSAV
ncbi:PIN domain-containing protein [Streptomyces decoyicus]|uniref:PIN domain-containing protein n=1 Tax=Streptomyces decoyicus TaxID=249567 RepID=UPI003652517E